MKSYGYIARDVEGVQRKGITEASSSNDVLERLRSEGFTPVSIKEVSVDNSEKQKRTKKGGRIKSSDLAALCWQLTTMLEGGIPITTSLEIIGNDIENVQLQKILAQLSEKVQKGQPFSECIAEFPRVFNRLTYAMILAGETSGNLALSIQKLAIYFDNRDKLAKKVKGAMAYPIFVLIFIVIIVIFIMAHALVGFFLYLSILLLFHMGFD